MATGWFDLVTAAFGGGVSVKLLDYVYREYVRQSTEKKTARRLIDRNLDPILKSADELVGKLGYLARTDFAELPLDIPRTGTAFQNWFPHLELLYLFAQFWSRMQILRLESVLFNVSRDKRGAKLLDFFKTLESSQVRIVGRGWQRGIGEALIERQGQDYRTITYYDFAQRFLSDPLFNRWFQPLVDILARSHHTKERQQVLVYGAVLHALLDTLDETHAVSRDTTAWPNKLTQKSRRALEYRTFKVYLPFVKSPRKYTRTGTD